MQNLHHQKGADVKDRLVKQGAYYSFVRPDGSVKICFCKNIKDMLIYVQTFYPNAKIQDIKFLGLNKVTK